MERIHSSQVVSSEIRRGIGAAAVLLSVPTTPTPTPAAQANKPVSGVNEQFREEDRLGESQWSTGGAAGLLVELGSEKESDDRETQALEEPDHKENSSEKQETVSNAPRWGVAVGVPYTIAGTFELPLTPKLGVEGHFGTILVITSIGARAILGRPSRSGLYGFA